MTHSGSHWLRVIEVFEKVAHLPRGERKAVLDRVCEGDEVLRSEVETLLERAGGAAPQAGQGKREAAVTVFVLEGETPPAGYVLVGTFIEERKDTGGPGGKGPRRVTMWQKP